MTRFQLAILLFSIVFITNSCSKNAAGAVYESTSGHVRIEVTGSRFPFDPWLVTVKVIVNQKTFYELSNIEVFASEIDHSTVSFDWQNGRCTVHIAQTDGTTFSIPIAKLPVEE